MSESMFQKEFNDEIIVKDLDIPNPLPDRLDVRFNPDSQVFFALPGIVLKSVYTSMNSLSAFADEDVQVFACYTRTSQGKDNIFVAHVASAEGETVSIHTIEELPYEIQTVVPADFR